MKFTPPAISFEEMLSIDIISASTESSPSVPQNTGYIDTDGVLWSPRY